MDQDKIRQALGFLMPHTAQGYSKVRIGAPNDGGYVMLDDFRGVRVAISGGVNNEDNWERQIIDRGVPVVAFECSTGMSTDQIRALPYQMFVAKMEGIKQSGNSTLDLLLHGYGQAEAIAKIDIEGDEWDLLENTSDGTLSKIRQMSLEFHLDTNLGPLHDRGLALFEKLHRTFRVVHVHGNTYIGSTPVGNTQVPHALELTFANMRHYDLRPSGETFPTALDTSNNPSAADFQLGTFIP